jgi:hypothetical protein
MPTIYWLDIFLFQGVPKLFIDIPSPNEKSKFGIGFPLDPLREMIYNILPIDLNDI